MFYKGKNSKVTWYTFISSVYNMIKSFKYYDRNHQVENDKKYKRKYQVQYNIKLINKM